MHLTGQGGSQVIWMREFRELCPSQLDVQLGPEAGVRFSYWPASAQDDDLLPREDGWIPSSSSPEAVAVGMSRTHEFVIDQGDSVKPSQYVSAYHEPVVAITPPRYLSSTGAIPFLQPFDHQTQPQIEKHLSQAIDSYLLNQEAWGWYGEWTYGALPNTFRTDLHRWADYGRYAHILNEQDIVWTPWLLYLRSGDRKHLKLARANTRQLMEVSTINWGETWPEWVGMSRRHHECVWLGTGDYGHSMLDPFLEMYHATGYQPAWEAAMRMADGMSKQQDGTWRYLANPIAGLARMYSETQDPFYKEHADRIWTDLCDPDRNRWWSIDHGNRMVLFYAPLNPQVQEIWDSWTSEHPDRLEGIDVLAAQYYQHGRPGAIGERISKLADGYINQNQRYDRKREDALRWSIANTTQSTLVNLRELCFVPPQLGQ